MPTTKARHPITETAEVTEALRAAALRWPEDAGRPGRLLRRLIQEGHRTIEPGVADSRAARLEAIERASGAFTGVYGENYLRDLRAEWPE